MNKNVTLSVADRNELIEDTIGLMELDQAVLDSISGGSGKTSCFVVIDN